jgi:hypothetical protein
VAAALEMIGHFPMGSDAIGDGPFGSSAQTLGRTARDLKPPERAAGQLFPIIDPPSTQLLRSPKPSAWFANRDFVPVIGMREARSRQRFFKAIGNDLSRFRQTVGTQIPSQKHPLKNLRGPSQSRLILRHVVVRFNEVSI